MYMCVCLLVYYIKVLFFSISLLNFFICFQLFYLFFSINYFCFFDKRKYKSKRRVYYEDTTKNT